MSQPKPKTKNSDLSHPLWDDAIRRMNSEGGRDQEHHSAARYNRVHGTDKSVDQNDRTNSDELSGRETPQTFNDKPEPGDSWPAGYAQALKATKAVKP